MIDGEIILLRDGKLSFDDLLQRIHPVGSLLLGLYDREGLLHHVGFTSSISEEIRPALTKRLQALISPPGFTGRAPGGPSRWSSGRSTEWDLSVLDW